MAPSTGEIMTKRLPSRATSYWKRTASLGMAPAEKRRWGVAAWKVGWVRDVAIPLGIGGPVKHTRLKFATCHNRGGLARFSRRGVRAFWESSILFFVRD
jgi:hypothetical protein